VAAGIPDTLYWRCTPPEIATLVKALTRRTNEERRFRILCHGLVAAAVYNVNSRKGARMIQPRDFLREPPKVVSPKQMFQALKSWADTANKQVAA
jgi:hypothetical protein